MKKSLDWGAMLACLFFIIITTCLTIGTVNMARIVEMGRGHIIAGIASCVIVACMTLFAVIFTYQQFRNKEKLRKKYF